MEETRITQDARRKILPILAKMFNDQKRLERASTKFLLSSAEEIATTLFTILIIDGLHNDDLKEDVEVLSVFLDNINVELKRRNTEGEKLV